MARSVRIVATTIRLLAVRSNGAGRSSGVALGRGGAGRLRRRSGPPRTTLASRRVGWPGASQPPAPSDPGVTVSRHRALLIGPSLRTDPPPVREEAGLSFLQPGPPPLEPSIAPPQ